MEKRKGNRDVTEVCKSIVDGETDIIEGCRILYSIHHQLGEFLKVPSYIEALALSTEDYPDENRRNLYSEDYLRRLDTETKEYISLIEDEVKRECRDLIRSAEG